MTHLPPQEFAWPFWRKLLFRFFFIYFILFIAPWTWINLIPGTEFLTQPYYAFMEWLVKGANANLFHIHSNEVHGPVGGSGDTSHSWAELCVILIAAFIGMLIWSVLDRKRSNYGVVNYWLCLFVRYNLIFVSFGYGIIKLFGLQMGFPTISQLATPLGDLLPMRFSWLFIGYSTPYQFFSGLMEVMVGTLLLFRRTATLGVIIGTAVFLNVMVLNLCYDIPVKLYSIQIVVMCLFLLANEANRIACFFLLNRAATCCNLYDYRYPKKWMRVARIILKVFIIISVAGMGFYNSYERYQDLTTNKEPRPFKAGIYDVVTYAVNGDTLPPLITDTIRWQNLIIERDYFGSVHSADTVFRRRYNRGYFNLAVDSAKNTIGFKRFGGDSAFFMKFTYAFTDSNTIRLNGTRLSDSLFVVLRKNNRHFQLAEKQFHWISEANR